VKPHQWKEMIRVLIAVIVTSSCAELASPTVSPSQSRAIRLEQSSGFYLDPSDNYYRWDGNPPPGDASATTVMEHYSIAAGPGTEEFTNWGGELRGGVPALPRR
jgi:hypothetical protein